jgi:DNA-directed RNA polymerase subunit RPC12/RpoP
MPKCVICRLPINTRRDNHSHALVGTRKVYACAGCAEAFDDYLDARCPECGSETWHENRSDGFVWWECDTCGHKTDAEKQPPRGDTRPCCGLRE